MKSVFPKVLFKMIVMTTLALVACGKAKTSDVPAEAVPAPESKPDAPPSIPTPPSQTPPSQATSGSHSETLNFSGGNVGRGLEQTMFVSGNGKIKSIALNLVMTSSCEGGVGAHLTLPDGTEYTLSSRGATVCRGVSRVIDPSGTYTYSVGNEAHGIWKVNFNDVWTDHQTVMVAPGSIVVDYE